jgi:hypothetical protein
MGDYEPLEKGHGCVSKNNTGLCPEVCIIMSYVCVTIDGVWIGEWINWPRQCTYEIIYQNFAGNKQKSYEIMRIDTFAVKDKAKADIENIRRLNLAVVKLTTVQVTKLPL